VLSAPLEGENWVAVNTINNNGNHRRTFSLRNDKPYLDQRFAIDLEKISSDGHESHGNMHILRNWNAYGHKVLAVADGVIANIGNDISSDNIPPDMPNPKPSKQEIPGNFVVLKVRQNNKNYYVFYGHMQPNSITVRIGDKVKVGQTLGLLGNTGNSGVPHLHLHVMDGITPLISNGLPFVFNNFQLHGKARVIDLDYGLFLPEFYKKAYKLNRIIPTDNDILRFD
jgi:murein DD-endopeptidase MepM/ murein hydrolase activator NlpD